MDSSIKDKTINGVSWSFVDNIANQGITFLVGIVLARLLSPEEYGLIGIITIFIAVFNSIVDSGFSNALIRKNNVTDRDYNTVFIVNMTFSIVLFVAMFFLAPFIAQFFNQPQLEPLTKVMASIVIINAFAIIQRTILVKKIDFKTQTKISVISSVTSGVVGIVMAVGNMGVWSLVGQQISRQLLNALFLWFYNSWRPKLQFSWDSFKELFGFGWKLLVSSLIDTVWREIYQVVIGKCYSATALGQYTRAQQFSSVFSSNISSVIQRVSYPVLSSIQDDKERLMQAYRRVIKITMLMTFVLMLGLAAVAKPMILVLIGPNWLEAANFLPILCLSMMMYPLHSLNLNMLQVQGRSDLFLKLEIIKKIIAVGPLLLGIFKRIYIQKIREKGGEFISLIHPTAILGNNAKIGVGCVVGAYANLSCDTKIGDFVTFSIKAGMGHDSTIGDYTHVGGMTNISGFVQIGENVTIHPCCNIVPHRKIGDNSTIGTGSVVLSNVKAGVTVFGNPAKRIDF